MNELNLTVKDQTITSLQLLEQINFFRKDIDGKSELEHKNLLAIIRDEFEEEINELKIQPVTYKDKKGEDRPMFELTFSQAKQVLVRESKSVRKAVVAYIEKLENKVNELQNELSEKALLLERIYNGGQDGIIASKALSELEKKPLIDKIENDKPMVCFAEQVTNASNSISIGDFAKILADENIKIGQNRLFKWLRDNKYLRSHNMPYQVYIENNLFKVIEQTFRTPYGDKTTTKTLITGKGQIYFTEKLRNQF